jgi:hypothetical protein
LIRLVAPANECRNIRGVHDGMKITVFALVVGFAAFESLAGSSDPPARSETTRAEQRMRDEKRQDEQAARLHAESVKVARFDSVWRPPRMEDIDVFQAGETLPNRARKTIALLSFECAAQEETHAAAGFIVKSRDLGADAVVMLALETPAPGQIVTTLPSPRDRKVFRANAIVYR